MNILRLLTVGIIAASTSHLYAEPFEDIIDKTPLELKFVQEAQLEKTRKAGELKENVMYWSNSHTEKKGKPTVIKVKEVVERKLLRVKSEVGDTTTPPNVVIPPNAVITAIQVSASGGGAEAPKEAPQHTKLMRAFNVPKDAKIAIVTILGKITTDDGKPAPKENLNATATQIQPGAETIDAVELPKQNQQEIRKTRTKLFVDPDAQQIVVTLSTDQTTAVDVEMIRVEFKWNDYLDALDIDPNAEKYVPSNEPPVPVS